MDNLLGLSKFDHGKSENYGPETLRSIPREPNRKLGTRNSTIYPLGSLDHDFQIPHGRFGLYLWKSPMKLEILPKYFIQIIGNIYQIE